MDRACIRLLSVGCTSHHSLLPGVCPGADCRVTSTGGLSSPRPCRTTSASRVIASQHAVDFSSPGVRITERLLFPNVGPQVSLFWVRHYPSRPLLCRLYSSLGTTPAAGTEEWGTRRPPSLTASSHWDALTEPSALYFRCLSYVCISQTFIPRSPALLRKLLEENRT